jgi:hypothetical protein
LIQQRLEDHLELLRCHYNFLRPHRALKFGRQVKTPAMQAGLTERRLSFRDIFSDWPILRLIREIQMIFAYPARSIQVGESQLSGA